MAPPERPAGAPAAASATSMPSGQPSAGDRRRRVLQRKLCDEILDDIMALSVGKRKRKRAGLFMVLPSQQEIPQYYDIIKEPIALDRIVAKVHTHAYGSVDDFAADVRKMVENAKTFNRPDSDIYSDAVAIGTTFETRFEKLKTHLETIEKLYQPGVPSTGCINSDVLAEQQHKQDLSEVDKCSPAKRDDNWSVHALVPVLLELEHDGKRHRECLTWDLNPSNHLTVKDYSVSLVKELGFPSLMAEAVERTMEQQLADCIVHKPQASDGEYVVVVRLHLAMDGYELRDQLEWNLNSTTNNPDSFANGLCASLQPPPPPGFASRIAFNMRRQFQVHWRELRAGRPGLPVVAGGYPVQQDDNSSRATKSIMPPLQQAVRALQYPDDEEISCRDWGPTVICHKRSKAN